ncbi:MAG TPA: hypothetical protein VFV58_21890 [Blastocatellia bacterium]|jgi:hypothetical protein|nr:hypothetical protein [Blastocatellia bacterium]
MRITLKWVTFLTIIMMMSQIASAQSQLRQQHDHSQGEKKRHAQVNERGDQTMGFSHAKSTHHFRLDDDGGAIEVTANSDDDAASRDQIRRHLKHIAEMFSEGDFSAPMFIHGQTPPGVETMKRSKADIKYQYEEIDRGAKVRITTSNVEAVKAIHEFLRFQIQDHQTGDPIEVVKGQF